MSDHREANVMIVDDVPENLTLLSVILRKANYDVDVFTNGAEALDVAHQKPPDIILLDICMPEMDGYEVCQSLKSDKQFSRIPVLFISALSQTQEKVKGFDVGGQDYITKPFQVREVIERVKIHLDLAWTRRELEETLNQTLTGSIKMVTDFMGFVNPNAFSRGIRIKQNMAAMVEHLNLIPKQWFELAAVLSQFGIAALSSMLQEKISLRKPLSSSEKDETDNSIELVATMLKSVPRLELVSEMISNHKLTLKRIGDKSFEELNTTEQGGMLLNLLQQYDQLALQGTPPEEIIEALRKEKEFPEILYETLYVIGNRSGDFETRCYSLKELTGGMITDEDVMDHEGRVLLKRGVELSTTLIETLKFQQNRLAKKTVMVRINPAVTAK